MVSTHESAVVSTHESAVVSTHESAVGASRFSRAREDSSRFVSGFARVRTRHRAVLPLGPYRRRSFLSTTTRGPRSRFRAVVARIGSTGALCLSRPEALQPPTVTPPPPITSSLCARSRPRRRRLGVRVRGASGGPFRRRGGIFERPMASSGRAIHEEQDQEERRAWPLRASFPVEPSWRNLYYKNKRARHSCAQPPARTRPHRMHIDRYTCRMHTAHQTGARDGSRLMRPASLTAATRGADAYHPRRRIGQDCALCIPAFTP